AISLMNKKFADSTIRKAFKELSRPLDVLEGHSFIDIELIRRYDKGRPALRGKLSEAAAERIFELVTPVKEKPPSSFLLINKGGKLEIPPLFVGSENNGSKWLSPEDILLLREKKIGKKQANRLLKGIADKGKPYSESVDILKDHRFGPLPSHQIRIIDAGQRELASDENRLCIGIKALVMPATDEHRKRLEAAGIAPCPSCGNPTHRSDLIRIQGTETDSCLTEYFELAKKCIHSIRHEDGSWSEMIVGISGMTSEGETKDECRKKLMNDLMIWIRDKQLNGSAIPPIPQAQFCLLSDRDRL
ncbi:MAG: hypothetical protein QUS07_00035, partial [Methanothrix sp.]|nr:hypothetical protein [Methanothrix sp.]